jgi:hypothetical protein
MAKVFSEHPFAWAGMLVFAGWAAWLDLRWWWIALAWFLGLFVGSIIDESGKRAPAAWGSRRG